MKKISYLLIIVGVLIASFPLVNNFYSWHWQQKFLNQLETREVSLEEDNLEENYQQLNETFIEEVETNYNEGEVVEENMEEEIIAEETSGDSTKEEKSHTQQNLMGTIEIKKIDLKIPILIGAGSSNLKKGAGHLTGTDTPGEIGNSVIAAHRSHTYGRFFNRLDEVNVGDKILVNTDDGRFTL